MTAPRLTWTEDYPGGRRVAQLGHVEVGAVIPRPTSSPSC